MDDRSNNWSNNSHAAWILIFMENKHTITYATETDGPLRRGFITCVERLTGQRKLDRIYQQYRSEKQPEQNIWAEAIKRLGVQVSLLSGQIEAIPKEGPLVIVANHPYGVLDGLSLCYMTSLIRKDFKFMAHATFKNVPEIEPYLLPVHFDGASSALRENIIMRKQALAHVHEGGAIIIFPAGRVATARFVLNRAVDAEWKLFCGSLIQRSQAKVLPVFFEGQNSWKFHLSSLFGEMMREAMLLHEITGRMNTSLTAHIGETLEWSTLSRFGDKIELLNFLRAEVHKLGGVFEVPVSTPG